jgi:hypothetical protein
MSGILEGLDGTICQMDDVLICGKIMRNMTKEYVQHSDVFRMRV